MPAALAGLLPKGLGAVDMMDSMMGCGAASAADARIKQGIPAWRYRYMGVWENTSLGPNTGAYHSGEIPVVFGTTETRTGVQKDSPEEAKVAKGTT
jgi:carboxylesterase type B